MTQLSQETAMKLVAKLSEKRELTPAEKADLARRRSEDFNFMVLCNMKGNMGMYQLLRDKSLDE